MCQIIYESHNCGHLGSKRLGQRCHLALRIDAADYRQCPQPNPTSWPVDVPWKCKSCEAQLTELEMQMIHFEKVRDARQRARHTEWLEVEPGSNSTLMAIQTRKNIDKVRLRKIRAVFGEFWDSESEDICAGTRQGSTTHVSYRPGHQHRYYNSPLAEEIIYGRKSQQNNERSNWKAWHWANGCD